MSPTLINYLTQVSTWTGIVKIACALGLFAATPDLQSQLATNAVQFVTGILALVGTIDMLRDERKGAKLPDSNSQPK